MYKPYEVKPQWVPPSEGMTESANRAIAIAEKESIHFKQDYIGAEHLLLGIAALDEGVASSTLKAQGATLDKLRANASYQAPGGGRTDKRPLSFTPTVKAVIAMGIAKAKSQGQALAGPEHLLEAIFDEGQNIAIIILSGMKISGASVKKEMLKQQ